MRAENAFNVRLFSSNKETSCICLAEKVVDERTNGRNRRVHAVIFACGVKRNPVLYLLDRRDLSHVC